MDELISEAMSVAPDDVNAALTFLLDTGFELDSTKSGHSPSFGNRVLQFDEPPISVRIVRDRGQWACYVRQRTERFYALATGLRAAGCMQAAQQQDPNDQLAAQLPVGISWAARLPELVAWLRDTDRTIELQAVAEQEAEKFRQRRAGPSPNP